MWVHLHISIKHLADFETGGRSNRDGIGAPIRHLKGLSLPLISTRVWRVEVGEMSGRRLWRRRKRLSLRSQTWSTWNPPPNFVLFTGNMLNLFTNTGFVFWYVSNGFVPQEQFALSVFRGHQLISNVIHSQERRTSRFPEKRSNQNINIQYLT